MFIPFIFWNACGLKPNLNLLQISEKREISLCIVPEFPRWVASAFQDLVGSELAMMSQVQWERGVKSESSTTSPTGTNGKIERRRFIERQSPGFRCVPWTRYLMLCIFKWKYCYLLPRSLRSSNKMTHRKASCKLKNLMKLARITVGSILTHTVPRAQTAMCSLIYSKQYLGWTHHKLGTASICWAKVV